MKMLSGRQVTPFNITTADNETLYAWHMLPLWAYAHHEDQLINEPAGIRSDFRETLGFKILQQDPEACVVINFHGNAGHLADGHRVQIYRSLTNLSPKVHIITIDYRGFGYSTGSPHEAGLIADGITVVNYVLSLGIPPSKIVLLGQSLGTAVTSGVALHFADRAASLRLLPRTDNPALNNLFINSSAVVGHSRTQPIDFAAVILVASFPSLPNLLLTYRISGLIPVLSPLSVYPKIQQWLLTFIKEDWPTSLRIAAMVTAAAKSQERKLRLHLMHALDDWDIPWRNGEQNYEAAYHALASAAGGETKMGIGSMDWEMEGFKREAKLGERVKVLFESVRFGGNFELVPWFYVRILTCSRSQQGRCKCACSPCRAKGIWTFWWTGRWILMDRTLDFDEAEVIRSSWLEWNCS